MVHFKDRLAWLNFSKIVFVFFLPFFLTITFLSGCDFEARSANEVVDVPEAIPTSLPEFTPTATSMATVEPLPTTRPRRLSMGELVLASDVDDIPAIFAEDALFVDAETGSQEWVDKELVIGLVLADEARAYPIRLLSNHEIVNDVVGGEPVIITWCPLCFSAIVFSRVVEEQELTFGVSGYLYYNNLVMYDHRSNTLWSQVAGEGLRGAYRGKRLEVRPSQMTSWGEWKAAFPDTKILSAEQLGNRIEDVVDPYAGYYTSGSAGVTGWVNPNDLLSVKELVVGLVIGSEARAYPLTLIREVGLIQDELGGFPVVLVYDSGLGSAVVYRRDTAEGVLNFVPGTTAGQIQDEETGTVWGVRDGRAIKGEMAGSELIRLSAPLVYWFAWSDIHISSDVYNFPGLE